MVAKKKEKQRSKRDLKAVIDKRQPGEPLEFEEEETTDILDLTIEKMKTDSAKCQKEVRKSAEVLRSIRMPKAGPTEKL